MTYEHLRRKIASAGDALPKDVQCRLLMTLKRLERAEALRIDRDALLDSNEHMRARLIRLRESAERAEDVVEAVRAMSPRYLSRRINDAMRAYDAAMTEGDKP